MSTSNTSAVNNAVVTPVKPAHSSILSILEKALQVLLVVTPAALAPISAAGKISPSTANLITQESSVGAAVLGALQTPGATS